MMINFLLPWTQALLAQTESLPGDQDATNLILEGLNQSKQVAQGWAKMYDLIYSPAPDLQNVGLYPSICWLAGIVAFACFALLYAHTIIFSVGEFPWRRFATAAATLVLLANNAALTSELTMGIHKFLNEANTAVLTTQAGEMTLASALEDVVLSANAKNTIRSFFAECDSKTGWEQIDCLDVAIADSEAELKRYEGIGRSQINGVRRLLDRVGRIHGRLKEEAKNKDPLTNLGERVRNPMVNPELARWGRAVTLTMIDTGAQAGARFTLKSWQWAFAHTLELSFLLTGVLGPLAVCGLTLPRGAEIFASWIIGLFSLGFAKIAYSIVIGFTAAVILLSETEGTTDSGFLVLLAFFAPGIALGILGLGGFAIFHVITGGFLKIAEGALGIGKAALAAL